MNPTLTEWLDNYQSAAALYAEEIRYLHVDQIMPPRPPELQFTITSTGLLRDHAGVKMGHVSEMNTLQFRAIGVDYSRLTARQRRTPVPRRNPDTTRQPTAAEHDNQQSAGNLHPEGQPAMHAIDAIEAGLDQEYRATPRPRDIVEAEIAALDLTGIPDGAIQPINFPPVPVIPAGNPWTQERSHQETAIPDDAAPGDIVTNADNRRIGVVGRNGRNEVVIVRDPNPMHERLRGPLATISGPILSREGEPDVIWHNRHTVPVPDLSRIIHTTTPAEPGAEAILRGRQNLVPNPGVIAGVNAAISNLSATMGITATAAHEAMERAFTPAPAGEADLYQGPRMLATIAQPAASAERFAEHTATAEAAHLRAGFIYHSRPLYRLAVNRARDEAPNPTMVDRNAAAVSTFLSQGYGIELNEEALTAVTAMTNHLIRQSNLPLIERIERVETTANTERRRADALQTNVRNLDAEVQRLQTRLSAAETAPATPAATPAPGTPEAAFLAAKAWKEAPVTDSVAKLASFRHLIDTLEALAR